MQARLKMHTLACTEAASSLHFCATQKKALCIQACRAPKLLKEKHLEGVSLQAGRRSLGSVLRSAIGHCVFLASILGLNAGRKGDKTGQRCTTSQPMLVSIYKEVTLIEAAPMQNSAAFCQNLRTSRLHFCKAWVALAEHRFAQGPAVDYDTQGQKDECTGKALPGRKLCLAAKSLGLVLGANSLSRTVIVPRRAPLTG